MTLLFNGPFDDIGIEVHDPGPESMIVCIDDVWYWKHDGSEVTATEAAILFPALDLDCELDDNV